LIHVKEERKAGKAPEDRIVLKIKVPRQDETQSQCKKGKKKNC